MKKVSVLFSIITATFLLTLISCSKENIITPQKQFKQVMASFTDTPYLGSNFADDTPYIKNSQALEASLDTPYLHKPAAAKTK